MRADESDSIERELAAMRAIVEALSDLEASARERVINWAADRYDILPSAES